MNNKIIPITRQCELLALNRASFYYRPHPVCDASGPEYTRFDLGFVPRPGWLREAVTFAIDTGCRRGEKLSLSWKHVNLERGVATIYGQKTGEWRTIPLTKRVREMLSSKNARQKVRALRENIVFSNDTGQPINIHELRWGFESALKAAGIGDFRWHDLRHSFGTRLAQNGVDLFTIQKLLGHKSFAMTQRYAHHCEESLRRGITVLDSYVEGLKMEGSS